MFEQYPYTLVSSLAGFIVRFVDQCGIFGLFVILRKSVFWCLTTRACVFFGITVSALDSVSQLCSYLARDLSLPCFA